MRFQLSFHRQAYQEDVLTPTPSSSPPAHQTSPRRRWRFWGGLALATQDGGKGLVADLLSAAAATHNIRIAWSTPLVRLLTGGPNDPGKIVGAILRHNDVVEMPVYATGGVVLAAGGFEASAALRTQHLGPAWGTPALVRGTPFNTGGGLSVAIRDADAATAGDWAGCHAVAWDANAPRDGGGGDRERTNEFTKSGYPLGIMVNVDGERFVDEGVDFRNYTYAKFGKAVLGQVDGVAFQVWDKVGAGMLRGEEYRAEVVERIEAGSVEELAARCKERGLRRPERLVETVRRYNDAARRHRERFPERVFNPAVKDGVATEQGMLDPPKSNWALPIEEPPFLAVKVGCGITFTFGGLAVEPETAAVLSKATGKPIDGLYAVGEMLGGLYYGNYPGGSGLTAGTVWGRRAGKDAAKRAQEKGGNAHL